MILAAALLALLAQDGDCSRAGGRCRGARNGRSASPAVASGSVNYSGSITAPTVQSLVSLTTSYRTGNWFAMDADGTTPNGSAKTFSSVTGTPTNESVTVCPNGPRCGAVARRRYASAGDTTASVSDTYTDFSACFVGTISDAEDAVLFDKWDGGLATLTWAIVVSSNSLVGYVGKDGSTFTSITGGTLVPHARHVICMTYDYVADGSSVQKLYLDGSQVATSSSAHGPPQVLTQKTSVNAYSGGTTSWNTTTEGVFFTEAVLTAPQVATIAHGVLADQPTMGSISLTQTRSGKSMCAADPNMSAFSILQSNIPCIGGAAGAGSWQSYTASINKALRSDYDWGSGQWTDVATPGYSNQTGLNPAQYPNYTAVTDNSGAAFEGFAQAFTIPNDAGTQDFAAAIWARPNSGVTPAYAARITIRGTGDTTGDSTCDWQLLDAGFKRIGCSTQTPYKADGGLSAITVSYLVGNAAADQGTIDTWGASVNQGIRVMPYCRTATNATCTTGTDTGLVAASAPTALSRTEGCYVGCYRASYDGTSTPAALRVVMDGDGVRLAYRNSGTGMGFYDGTTDLAAGSSFNWQSQALRCYRAKWSAAANSISIWDFQGSSTANASTFTTLGTLSTFTLGADSSNGTSSPQEGEFGSFVIGPTAPSCEVGAKWAALGDSITAQPDSISPYEAGWPRTFQTLWGVSPTGRWVQNQAISGATTTTIRDTEWTTNTRGQAFSGIFYLGGINDITGTADSAATIFARIQTVLDQAKADGLSIVAIGILPFGNAASWDASRETKRTTINSSISSWAGSNGATFVDMDTSTIVCGSSPPTLCAWADSGDGLHPSQKGSDAIANYIWTKTP